MATILPMQYSVDENIETPLRIPSMVGEQLSHLKLAVYNDPLMSWNAKGYIVTPDPIAMDMARMNLSKQVLRAMPSITETWTGIPLT